MKKIILITMMIQLLFIAACNTGEKKEDASFSNTTEVPTAPTPVATQSSYDPDPSDTIPADQYGINSSSRQTAELIRSTLKDQLKSDLEQNLIDSFSRRFIFFEYDLNDDGKKEIFVGLTGPYFCGSGGCTQYLLNDQGSVITIFTVSGYPVVIDNNKTNGYKDLFIHSGGKNRIVKFNGKKYPSNPSILPALKVLPGDGLPRALNFESEPYPWFRF